MAKNSETEISRCCLAMDSAVAAAECAYRYAGGEAVFAANPFERLLRDALDSYSRVDPDLARRVLDEDDAVDDVQDEVVRTVLSELEAHPEAAAQEVDIILVAKHLERVADHATNIAEDVILVAEARNVKHAAKLAR